MDPTTALFTFMLETDPSVQTVTLVGSWDNFSKHYTMERDLRRDPGQWRGCYTFKDIICDGDQPASSRRNGGLKMGHPYYFYYEVDGSFETHDPCLPSTSTCPYLPGQTVNTMVVPSEMPDRKRSASMNALRREEYMTMEPTDKYVPLRPPPAIPDFLGPNYRLPTSHSGNSNSTNSTAPTLKHKRSDRSISPTPNWWSPRKLFGRKGSLSSQGSVDRPSEDEGHRCSVTSSSSSEGGTRTRAMSPEALKRFLLSDDVPVVPDAEPTDRIELSIPDDIAEEEDDDFLASAVSETVPKTILSPPPSKPSTSRKNSSNSGETLRYPVDNSSMVTLKPVSSARNGTPRQPVLSTMTFYEKYEGPTSRFSLSSDEGSVYNGEEDEDSDPISPSTDNDTPSFYHSDNEEDDNDVEDYLSSCTPPSKRALGRKSLEESLAQAFQGYRLPRSSMDGTKGNSTLASPSLMPNSGEGSVTNSPPLLAVPTNSVVDDFVSELKQAGLN